MGTDATVRRIPMAAPDITEADVAAVASVVQECVSDGPSPHDGRLSIGTRVERFESDVAGRVGAPHGIGVSSGTAGLHLAVIAAGVGPGDLVITTPFSFVASANVILFEGGIPVFVDIETETFNIDAGLVRETVDDLLAGGRRARSRLPPALRDETVDPARLKALLPVHVFGQPAAMEPLFEIAAEHDLAVIEDACEALGAVAGGRAAGACGAPTVPGALHSKHAACFAFYPNKQITTGEGGMLVTASEDWARLFRSLRNQGRDEFGPWLGHHRLGFNYRLDELSAALGVSQMHRLDEILDRRAAVARAYEHRLRDVDGVEAPRPAGGGDRVSWFVYVVHLADGIDRDAVRADLEREGVPTREYFPPIHVQDYYRKTFAYRGGEFPRTEAVAGRTMALPFFSRMREEQVDYVCTRMAEAVRRHRS